MSEIQLGFGRGSINFAFEAKRFDVLQPGDDARRPLTDVEIGAAIDNPIDCAPLESLVGPGETVLVVVSDASRASGSAQVGNLLVRRLIESGVSPGDINIIFATGIHRSVTMEEKKELLTPFIAQRIKTLDHDAFDPSKLVQFGRTVSGTPIEINRALKEHDRVILTGAIGFHYFAGFTGGRKSICPGLASARTIEATHMLALASEGGGRRAGVGPGLLEGNAVHEECERVAAEIAPSFLINAVVDERGRVARVYAGDWRTAHRKGCADYQQDHSVRIDAKRGIVVASCGGWPWDINLIQAHKSLDMAADACLDGGDIVLLGECADGYGREDFLKWFDAADSRALERGLSERYEVNGQTAWALLIKAERYRVHLVSKLPDAAVRHMRMLPARNLDEALSRCTDSSGGYIIPRASSLLPVASEIL